MSFDIPGHLGPGEPRSRACELEGELPYLESRGTVGSGVGDTGRQLSGREATGSRSSPWRTCSGSPPVPQLHSLQTAPQPLPGGLLSSPAGTNPAGQGLRHTRVWPEQRAASRCPCLCHLYVAALVGSRGQYWVLCAGTGLGRAAGRELGQHKMLEAHGPTPRSTGREPGLSQVGLRSLLCGAGRGWGGNTIFPALPRGC